MVCKFGTQAVVGLLRLWIQCSSQTKASPSKQHHFGRALSSTQFSNLASPSLNFQILLVLLLIFKSCYGLSKSFQILLSRLKRALCDVPCWVKWQLLCTFPYSLCDKLAYYIHGMWMQFMVCKFGTQVVRDYVCKQCSSQMNLCNPHKWHHFWYNTHFELISLQQLHAELERNFWKAQQINSFCVGCVWVHSSNILTLFWSAPF